MRDCIYNVLQRGKPKQRPRVATLHLDPPISEDGAAVAMLGVSRAERNEKHRWP